MTYKYELLVSCLKSGKKRPFILLDSESHLPISDEKLTRLKEQASEIVHRQVWCMICFLDNCPIRNLADAELSVIRQTLFTLDKGNSPALGSGK